MTERPHKRPETAAGDGRAHRKGLGLARTHAREGEPAVNGQAIRHQGNQTRQTTQTEAYVVAACCSWFRSTR